MEYVVLFYNGLEVIFLVENNFLIVQSVMVVTFNH